MIDATAVLILTLAVYRTTSILLQEGLFAPVVTWAKARGGRLAVLAGCPLCVSVWAGFALTGAWLTGHWTGPVFIVGLAASQGFILVDRIVARITTQGGVPQDFMQQTIREVEAVKAQLAEIQRVGTNGGIHAP